MKKRIEIHVDAIECTSDGVELRLGDEVTTKIFVWNEILFATIFGVAESMAIRKASIQDRLDWLLIDFNEHDEIHRAAIRFDHADWDQVEMHLTPLFTNRRIPLDRHKAAEQEGAE